MIGAASKGMKVVAIRMTCLSRLLELIIPPFLLGLTIGPQLLSSKIGHSDLILMEALSNNRRTIPMERIRFGGLIRPVGSGSSDCECSSRDIGFSSAGVLN